MTTKLTLEDLATSRDRDLGASRWVDVDLDRIRGFADVTEDHQWIHVDEERARAGPFGVPIAHGYLTLSLVATLIQELLEVVDADRTINYGIDKLRFSTPVPAGSRVRLEAKIKDASRKLGGVIYRLTLRMAIEDVQRPAMTADAVFLSLPQSRD